MNNGGIARRLIDFALLLTGRLPGSLTHGNIMANMMFGAISGSAVASAAAVGSVMTPVQREQNIDGLVADDCQHHYFSSQKISARCYTETIRRYCYQFRSHSQSITDYYHHGGDRLWHSYSHRSVSDGSDL